MIINKDNSMTNSCQSVQANEINAPAVALQPISLFGNLLSKIKANLSQIFQTSVQQPDNNVPQEAATIAVKLLEVKEELRTKVGKHLFKHVESAIDREAKRIDTLLTKSDGKAQEKLSQLTNRAKHWVDLDSEATDQIAIIEAIKAHHMHENAAIIDHEIELIERYKQHRTDDLTLSKQEKQELIVNLENQLAFHLKALQDLKTKPKEFDLQKIEAWKDKIKQQRSDHYHCALQKIDLLIAPLAPVVEERSSDETIIGL